MLFNSYLFVFAFLPICLLFYYIAVRHGRMMESKIWLILMSLWFYAGFKETYLLILLGSILFNYVLSMVIQNRSQRERKLALLGGITGNLGLLVSFKYLNFFIENFNGLTGNSISPLSVLMPLGISFFTFQQISFLADVYRGDAKSGSFLNYAVYVTFFPKLIQGPIVTYHEMITQLETAAVNGTNPEGLMRGISLFVLGMVKKVIFADTFAGAVNYGYSNLGMLHSSDAVLLILFYSLQLYFDFSGYCDMAMGIGRMFGMQLPSNFNSPYQAFNIIEFWKRWHITLNRFFTRYIYIPLGGNRNGLFVMYRNLLVVFLVSGIWHGAGWNFILWGMLHGILYVITRMWMEKHKNGGAGGWKGRIRKTAGVIFTFLYVSAAWVYFRAGSVAEGTEIFRIIGRNEFVRVNKNLAGYFNLDEFWYILKVFHLGEWEYGPYILMILFTVISMILVLFAKNAVLLTDQMKPRLWSAAAIAGLFLWCVLTFSNVSTFLYFNF